MKEHHLAPGDRKREIEGAIFIHHGDHGLFWARRWNEDDDRGTT